MSCLVTHDLYHPDLWAASDLCVKYYLGQLYNKYQQQITKALANSFYRNCVLCQRGREAFEFDNNRLDIK